MRNKDVEMKRNNVRALEANYIPILLGGARPVVVIVYATVTIRPVLVAFLVRIVVFRIFHKPFSVSVQGIFVRVWQTIVPMLARVRRVVTPSLRSGSLDRPIDAARSCCIHVGLGRRAAQREEPIKVAATLQKICVMKIGL